MVTGSAPLLLLLRANLCDVVLVDTLSFRVDVACLIRTVGAYPPAKRASQNICKWCCLPAVRFARTSRGWNMIWLCPQREKEPLVSGWRQRRSPVQRRFSASGGASSIEYDLVMSRERPWQRRGPTRAAAPIPSGHHICM